MLLNVSYKNSLSETSKAMACRGHNILVYEYLINRKTDKASLNCMNNYTKFNISLSNKRNWENKLQAYHFITSKDDKI